MFHEILKSIPIPIATATPIFAPAPRSEGQAKATPSRRVRLQGGKKRGNSLKGPAWTKNGKPATKNRRILLFSPIRGRRLNRTAKIKNLQIFHLLDRILRVCYIPRVFRWNRHGPGNLPMWVLSVRAWLLLFKESKVCRPSISWYDLAERRFVLRRRVRLCRGVLSAEVYARGCTHPHPKSPTLLCEKSRVSGSPTGSRSRPISLESGIICKNTPSF